MTATTEGGSVDVKADVDRKSMNLWQKLAHIKTQVRNIPKNGTNTHFNYKFVQAADVYDVVGHLMGVLGVVLVPKQIEVLSERETRSGSIIFARFTWEMVNADTPTERESFQSMGEGQDPGDKRSYKATTGAEKYALISFFQIPTGLDPERDDGSHSTQGQGQSGDGGRKGGKRTGNQEPQGQPSSEGKQGQEKKQTPPLAARFGPYKNKPVDGLTDDQIRETIQVGKTNAGDPKYAKHKADIEAHIFQLERVLAIRRQPNPESQKGQPPAAA